MTLCIAAVASKDRKLITVGDFMLADEKMSAESHITKISFIGKTKRWAVQYAGNPTHAWSITQKTIHTIEGKPQDALAMSDAIQLAFQEVLEEKINAEILSPFGMNREEFVKDGLGYFGEEVFRELASKVSRAQLRTSLLVGNANYLFSVHDPGVIQDHNPIGFYAIGTGSTLARASLMGSINVAGETTEVIYRLLEAKFRGESASGVGRKTFLAVMDANNECQYMPIAECETIRKIWEKKGKSPMPQKAQQVIESKMLALKGKSAGML